MLTVARLSALGGPPLTQVIGADDVRKGDTYAIFGNVFWKPMDDLEVAVGLRWDHEKRTANGGNGSTVLLGTLEVDDVDPVRTDAEARIDASSRPSCCRS